MQIAFYRVKALLNIALHHYAFPNSRRYQLSISDAEILVEFEKVVEGEFELATNQVLERSFSILRCIYSQFQQREISLNSTKETALLLQAVCGKETPLDCEKLDETLSDQNFKRGLDGLEAELYVLRVEIAKFRESPAVYHRIYRQAKKFYFSLHQEELDPDGKIMRALYAVPDETELQRELALSYFHVRTLPLNTRDVYDVCLHIVLGCYDKGMLSDFIQPPQRRGRKKNTSLHDFITTQLDKLAKKGVVSLPSKNVIYKILKKLRHDARVRAHFQRL